MKKYNNIKLLLAGLVLIASACKTEIDVPAISKGGADFTKYIALGNSLTAGYADNGLYLAGQLNSYPNIIATQMKAAGGGDFKQPLFTEAQSNGSGYLKIGGFNADGTPNLVPVTDKLAYRNVEKQFTKYTDEINNLGIPGMRLDFAVGAPSFSALNPYFERLLPDAQVGTKTYLAFATGRSHTFFTCWLGNNDVLGWATSGGVVGNDPTKALTSKTVFAQAYGAVIATMTAQGQKGAVATIPDVTAIPFLNTVTIPLLLAGVQKAAPSVQALYISTPSGPRVATSKDLVILTFPTAMLGTGSPYPYGLHPANPIESQYVLDESEIAMAKDYVNSYNATIKATADAKGLAMFDANTFLNTFKDGVTIDGVAFNASFVRGNAFSLDGVHLTQKGYAVVANGFINAINAKYGSSLTTVSLSNYPAVIFP